MVDYASLATTTLNLISDFGKDFTLRTKTGGTFDPATNSISGESSADETVKGVLTEFQKSFFVNSGLDTVIEETNIKRNDKQLLIAAKDVSVGIDQHSVILDGSVQYSVINVEELKPGNTKLLYKLQVRV